MCREVDISQISTRTVLWGTQWGQLNQLLALRVLQVLTELTTWVASASPCLVKIASFGGLPLYFGARA